MKQFTVHLILLCLKNYAAGCLLENNFRSGTAAKTKPTCINYKFIYNYLCNHILDNFFSNQLWISFSCHGELTYYPLVTSMFQTKSLI